MRSRTHVRVAGCVALFVAAIVPIALLLVDRTEPGAAYVIASAFWTVATPILWAIGLVLVVLLVLYPPSIPFTRLLLRSIKERMTIDQSPMHHALGRLEHHETADDHFTVAQVAFQMRDYGRAIAHLDRALRLDPRCTKARYLGARVLFAIGKVPHAIKEFGQTVAMDENHGFGGALLGLGRALILTGNYDEAARALERHEALNGPNREALLLRARAEGRRGHPDVRRELLKRAAQAPQDGELIPLEQQLARAKARVALWKTGSAA